MDIKKLAPWNWFKKEDNDNVYTVPVKYNTDKNIGSYPLHSLSDFQNEVDRLFDSFFNESGQARFNSGLRLPEGITGSVLKPKLDIGSTQKEYTVSVEIPGVSETDVSLELVHDTLTIHGEKKQEKEEKNKNFYRLERSYGSFRRTLSLPGDADKGKIKANFKNGVLNITIPRKEVSEERKKKIEIKCA
ncbi:Hsp20/alpha crystallin family protein [Desulfobacter vibrioformis]|uniref:Hsp20/alpha crystallin family protein n=1 Tax=Desulfobacter vibrioformis TaxID=34031 RepID=UPI000554877D|nr:Hsp20/alpha crystallin family protein [Desulfobacter vibrioformis]